MCKRIFSSQLLKSMLCFILAVSVLILFGAPPYLEAYAVVDIILSGAISSTMSTIFALSGIKFASTSDLISGIELAWDRFDTGLQQLVSNVVGVGNPVEGVFPQKTTVPLPVTLITSAFKAIYDIFPVNQTSVPGLSTGTGGYFPTISYRNSTAAPCFKFIPASVWSVVEQYKYATFSFYEFEPSRGSICLFNSLPTSNQIFPGVDSVQIKDNQIPFLEIGFKDGQSTGSLERFSGLWFFHTSKSNFDYSWGSTDSHSVLALNPSGADVINPGITYAPDKSICVDGAMTKTIDSVLAANPSKDVISVLVPANAIDFVDAGVKDVVVDTEFVNAWDNVISGAGSGTITGDITLPTVGDLSLPSQITTVFPFSIPWDISRGLAIFEAPAVAPHFELPFVVPGVINQKIVLDFTKFDFIIRLIRWGELAVFCIGLAMATRKVIKW